MKSAIEDRRRHQRYILANSVTVNPEGAFQVVDLGKGGFCFKCPPYTAILDQWIADILTSTGVLEAYPAKKAWVNFHANGTSSLPLLMHVGVKFGGLAKSQQYRLTKLISSICSVQLPHITGPPLS